MGRIKFKDIVLEGGSGYFKWIKNTFNFLLVCVVFILIFWTSLSLISTNFDFSFIGDFQKRIIDGFLLTLGISVCSLILSTLIGVLSAACQSSKVLFVKYIFTIYVTFIRGTPLIMQIYLFFYIIGTAWGIDNRFLAGVLVLSIFEGAYIAEIVRGSFLSIEKQQIESARAVGFSSAQTFYHVILPQMIARTLPALTGQFASIIKDSSLLSIIAVIELTQTFREISALNFKLFECYIFLGVLYLCMTLPISLISKTFEKKFNYEV